MGRIVISAAQDRGWNVANVSEALVAEALESLGYGPSEVKSQYKVGRYRLDFAFLASRLDIEADGWVHTAGNIRARDAARDSRLGELGWKVIRIDTDAGDIEAQLCRNLGLVPYNVLHERVQRARAER